MFHRFLLMLALVFPTTALAVDGPPPDGNLDTQTMIQAGRLWQYKFRLLRPSKVRIAATVKTNQPVNFYVMKPREIRNYLAVGGSLNKGNFSYVRELYRQNARALHGSAVLDGGWWTLVIHNPGPQNADLHVVVSRSHPHHGASIVRIPRAQAGPWENGSGPGRYELKITRYTVSDRKNNGKPWDAGNNAPDVQFLIQSGNGTGVSDISSPRGRVHKNRSVGNGPEEDRWVFNWDGRGKVMLIAYDKDLMNDDFIGQAAIQTRRYPARGWVVLRGGEGSVSVNIAWRKLGERPRGLRRR